MLPSVGAGAGVASGAATAGVGSVGSLTRVLVDSSDTTDSTDWAGTVLFGFSVTVALLVIVL